jgi:HK97 family phage prohead protease
VDPSIVSRVVDLATWKTQARAGAAPTDAVLRKGYTADLVKAEDDDSRKVSFIISTGAVDRDRDTLKVDGWELDDYRKNPVVLWAHNYYGLPIGKAETVLPKSGVLKATAEFATAEMNPLAESVYRMLKAGFLRATSVGFQPLKHAYDEERGGFDFLKQSLLEFSVVPVPANPQALMDAKAAGIDMGPVKGWAEGVLDGMEPGLWVPKERALAAFKALADPRIVVPAAFDPAPCVAAAQEALQKRGRTLSAANEARIRTAADAASAIGAALDEVLAQVAESESDEGKGKAAVLQLAPSAPGFAVNPETVKAAVVAAVTEQVRAQILAARGLLD